MYMLSFFYIYSSRRRHSSEKGTQKAGSQEKVLWANLTANPLAGNTHCRRKRSWKGLWGQNIPEVKRMGKGVRVGRSLGDVGGNDLGGAEAFKVDLGLKTTFTILCTFSSVQEPDSSIHSSIRSAGSD